MTYFLPCYPRERRRQYAFGNRNRKKAGEFASETPVNISGLSDHGNPLPMLGRARGVGHFRNLSLEPSLERAAYGFGGGFCGIRDVGLLVFA